jgi:RNA polymerase sigma factor (sigma-70 family)
MDLKFSVKSYFKVQQNLIGENIPVTLIRNRKLNVKASKLIKLQDTDESVSYNESTSNLDKIIKDYSGLVFGCCLRILKNRQEAEDVSQATFILLSKKFNSLPKSVKLGGWLYQAATNLSLNVMTKEQRRMTREAAAMENNGNDNQDWRNVAPMIDKLINQLPKNQKDAIRLKYIEGKSQEEIAAELKSSRGTVSSWISRGLEKLRVKMKKHGVAMTSLSLIALLNNRLMAENSESLAQTFINGINNNYQAQSYVDSYMSANKMSQLKVLCAAGLFCLGALVVVLLTQTPPHEELADKQSTTMSAPTKSPEAQNVKRISTSGSKKTKSLTPIVIGDDFGLALPGSIADFDVSPNGEQYAFAVENAVFIVDAETMSITKKIDFEKNVNRVLYQTNDTIICRVMGSGNLSYYHKKIMFFDAFTGEKKGEILAPGEVNKEDMLLSSDGRSIYVVGNYDLIKLHNGEMGPGISQKKLTKVKQEHKAFLTAVKNAFGSKDPKTQEQMKNFKEKCSLKYGKRIKAFSDVEAISELILEARIAQEKRSVNFDFRRSLTDKSDDILIFDLENLQLKNVIENVKRTKKVRKLNLHLSPKSSSLIVVDDIGTVREYDTSNSALVREFVSKQKRMNRNGRSHSYIDEDRLLINGYLINFESQKVEKKLPSEGLISGDQNSYFVINEGTLRTYFLEGFTLEYEIELPQKVRYMKFNKDKTQIFLWGSGSQFLRFDIDLKKVTDLSSTHSGEVAYMSLMDGDILRVNEYQQYHRYDSNSGAFIETKQAYLQIPVDDSIYSLKKSHPSAINKKAGLAAFVDDKRKKIEIFDIKSRKKIASINSKSKSRRFHVSCIFNGNATKLFTSFVYLNTSEVVDPRDGEMTGAFDPKTGEKLHSFYNQDGSEIKRIGQMLYNEHAGLLYFKTNYYETKTGYSSKMGIWDPATGKCIKMLPSTPYMSFESIADDGNFLLSRSSGAYDIKRGELAWTLPKDYKNSPMVFSQDHTSIITVSDGEIIIMNAKTGKVEIKYRIHYENAEGLNIEKIAWNKESAKLAIKEPGPVILLFDLNQ